MSEESVNYKFDEIEEIVACAEDNEAVLDRIKDDLATFKKKLDPRLWNSKGFQNNYTAIIGMNAIEDYKDLSNSFAMWIKNNQDSIYAKSDEMNQYANELGTNGTYTPTKKTETVETNDVQKMHIDENFAESLPEDVKAQIVKELQNAGYTEDEIEKILSGKHPVDKLTTEALVATITAAVATNPAIASLLQKTVGFEILDEEGNVDVNKLQVAEIIAEKNLGMEIDMTNGSPFKLHIEKLASDLKKANEKNPKVRNAIKEKYGIDIFDEEGNVDEDKLALIRVIDGQDLEDEYDITKTLEEYQREKTVEEQPTAPQEEPTAPQEEPTAPQEEPTAPTAPPSEPTAPQEEPTVPTAPPTTPTTPPGSVTPVPETVAPPEEENDGPFKEEPLYEDMDDLTEDLSTSITDVLKDVEKDEIETGDGSIGKVIPKIGPISGGGNSEVRGKNTTAGILTAAGIAAGGAVTGGGILLHKKTSMMKFGPADWAALGADYQGIIEKLMEKVGFSEEGIERFKTAKYKISATEIKEHIDKIEQALDQNPMLEEEILKLYDYTILDDENKVIEYLLFITMAIDGKNTMDEYNIYDIINGSLNGVAEENFAYTGIDPDDYSDDKPSDDEQLTAEEMEMIEDAPDNLEEETSNEEIEESNPATEKEWLQGIGIEKE